MAFEPDRLVERDVIAHNRVQHGEAALRNHHAPPFWHSNILSASLLPEEFLLNDCVR